MNKVKLGELLKVKHGYAFKSENYVEKSQYALVPLQIFLNQIIFNLIH